MICDIAQYFYGIPERVLNFTIFNSQLIHVIRQIKGDKKKTIKLVQKPFSYAKKKRLRAHKRCLETCKVVTGSQCKVVGTGSREKNLMFFTILN